MNFRQYIEGPDVFYHGSKKEFPVGFILLPQSDGYTSWPETQRTEQILEKYRPHNKLSRSKSVFMVKNPDEIDAAGGYNDFIYVVQPMGVVEVSDLSWQSEIEIYLDGSEEEQRKCALNYWNGVPYRGNSSLWEYRTPQAKIISILD